jgi:hypothetical protein
MQTCRSIEKTGKRNARPLTPPAEMDRGMGTW